MALSEYEIICPMCDQDFKILVDHLEGLKAKPESDATDCSTGRMPELCKNEPSVLAGRQARLISELNVLGNTLNQMFRALGDCNIELAYKRAEKIVAEYDKVMRLAEEADA